jgi:DNA-binding winged helix-turn-helix (wHTH) protein/TolB-like protein/Tfp pilus assembly protein PilF
MYEFNGYRLDAMRRQLFAPSGSAVQLMPKAMETLLYLIEHAGQTVDKEALFSAVWPDTVVEENNLTQNISALRKAFGEKAGEHRFIVTIPGRGYRFVAPVRASASPAATEVGAGSTDAPPQAPSKLRERPWIFASAAALIVVGLTLVGWLATGRNPAESSRPKTIAVLPFKPVLVEHRNEAMELGMADSLIMELSRSPSLVVRPLNATRRFVSLDQDPVAAGRSLGVEAVLDGTIQIADQRVLASARLLRVADGTQLWGGKFEERFSGLFDVQDAIARRVADALAVSLNPRDQRGTGNLRAYELYMQGRMHALRLVMPEVRRGIEYFEMSILEDATYPLPYAGLADAMRPLALSNDIPPSEIVPRAKIAALRAIELAPDLSEANYARGMIAFLFEWDWRSAEQYLARAVELAPNNAEAHIYLAHLYSNLGRKSEALSHARRAAELNPISPLIGALEGQFLGHQGEHDAALRRLREAVAIEPRMWLTHHLLANELIDLGRYEEALIPNAEAKRLSPLQTYSDTLEALAMVGLKRDREARQRLESLTTASRERYVPPTHIAMIYAWLGDHDAAMSQLEAALSVRDVRLVFLRIDPKWDPLRGDARFADVMRRVGF